MKLPTDEDLAGFGWAPGDYIYPCVDCGQTNLDEPGAKRSTRCRTHAVIRYVLHEVATAAETL